LDCSSNSKQSPAKKRQWPVFWKQVSSWPSTFGVFDAFSNEEGRQKHLTGKIATALMANAPELFSTPPVIERLDVLGAKLAA
jgi:quinol monooxygenase YgiN